MKHAVVPGVSPTGHRSDKVNYTIYVRRAAVASVDIRSKRCE